MKKVKIMLTAITVFAVVGGALAFKAVKFSEKKVCTGTAPNQCPNARLDVTTSVEGTQVYYTFIDENASCSGVLCPTSTVIVAEK